MCLISLLHFHFSTVFPNMVVEVAMEASGASIDVAIGQRALLWYLSILYINVHKVGPELCEQLTCIDGGFVYIESRVYTYSFVCLVSFFWFLSSPRPSDQKLCTFDSCK